MSRFLLPSLATLALAAAAPSYAQAPAAGSCAAMMAQFKTAVPSMSPLGQGMGWTELGFAEHALEAKNEEACVMHMTKALAMK